MAYRYYTEVELAEILGISIREYHRSRKREIKRDFKKELEMIKVHNPDIWLDSSNNYNIRLVDPDDSSNFADTGLDFRSYI